MLCANKLSQHAISQSEAREGRHAIPACTSLDKLFKHAVSQSKAREVRHTIPACSGNQSQIGKARHTIPAYTVQTCYPSIHTESNLYKRGYKSQNSRQAGTVKIAIQLEEPEQEEQHSKQLQYLRRLGKRIEI